MSGKIAPDTLTEDAARALAERVQAYWHERGYDRVAVRLVRYSMGAGAGAVYGVRSNLVGGWPPGNGRAHG